MTVKVYIDVLFIINFIIDYSLLLATSLFVKKRAQGIRLSLASFLGGLYASIAFFLPFGTLFFLPTSIFVALLMVMIAYGAKTMGTLFKNLATFFLVALVVGGCGFAILRSKQVPTSFLYATNGGILYADINAYALLAAFALSLTTLHIASGYIKKQRIKAQFLYTVTIEKNGKQVTDTAFFDTGNFLKEPLSQSSVILAEWDAIAPLFLDNTPAECVANAPKDFSYIPCRSVNGITGMFAFRPDKIIVDKTSLENTALVAILEHPLDKEGSYHMLLPNDFIYMPNRKDVR